MRRIGRPLGNVRPPLHALPEADAIEAGRHLDRALRAPLPMA